MKHSPIPSETFARFVAGLLLLVVAGACSTMQPTTDIPASPTAALDEATSVEDQGAQQVDEPTPEPPEEPGSGWTTFSNDTIGFSFQYPSAWFGPDEEVYEAGIRLAVGSDVVYPYGTDRTEQIYEVKDSYFVVIQYTKNSQNWTLEQYRENQPWIETTLSLLDMQDGESMTNAIAVTTRVRQVNVGRFEGVEYVTSPSATAQTEYFYGRQIVLFDENLNVLNIMGFPNNVDVGEGSRDEAYRRVDQANLDIFRQIVESITVQ